MTGDASQVGRVLGAYRLGEVVGRGGSAIVYRAEDLRHQRHVAVKVVGTELTSMLGADRFLQEITTTAGLRHPNILPLYDSGRAPAGEGVGECVYYVMPLVEGESLRDRLNREKQLPLDVALRITSEVADALSYAHQHGVVHRDIKPENILLESGHAIVADFGIARAINTAGGITLTTGGIVIGTPAYMSPEQAAGERDIDGRSDVYALGCVLYEMLAGQPPFLGPTAESLVRQHLAVEAPPVTNLRPSVPDSVVVALQRALAKVPADRPVTADDFVDSIRPGVAEKAITAHRAVASETRHEATILRNRSVRRTVSWAGVVIALIAATAVWRGQAARGGSPTGPRLVVLPFAPSTADTALERMGRDLVVLITAGLDGMGELRTVDAPTTLARITSRMAHSLEDAHATARRLGADRMIHGTLTRVDPGFRMDASLYTVGRSEPLARASVSATGLSALSDAAIIALLDQLWQDEPPAVPSLAAVRRSAVPTARRAYLEGELLLARGDMPASIDAFERAFASDTSFWWAYWRSLYPRSYRETTTADPVLIGKIIEHRDELPEPDRLLIEATYMSTTAGERIQRLRQLTQRFPRYEPAWWDYANILVHSGGYHGFTWHDARAALERVLELNPRFIPAWDHLQAVAIGQQDSALIERATREVIELTPDGGTGTERRLLFRARAQVAWGPVVAPDSLVRLVDLFLANQPGIGWGVVALGPLTDGLAITQIRVNRSVRARDLPGAPVQLFWYGEAMAWVARGAWDSAMVAGDNWARNVPGPGGTLGAYRLAVAGLMVGSLPPDIVLARRQQAERAQSRWTARQRTDVQWLDGVVAYLGGNRAGIDFARRAVAADTSAAGRLLARSLGALAADAAGDRADAAQELVAIEREIADHALVFHPTVTIAHRLLATRWLRALGDDAEAARLLHWHDSFPVSIELAAWNLSIGRVSLVDRAEIAAARGDTRSARIDFMRFLEQYDLPVEGLQALIARARAGLDQLSDGGRR